jgi:hypothetical protein
MRVASGERPTFRARQLSKRFKVTYKRLSDNARVLTGLYSGTLRDTLRRVLDGNDYILVLSDMRLEIDGRVDRLYLQDRRPSVTIRGSLALIPTRRASCLLGSPPYRWREGLLATIAYLDDVASVPAIAEDCASRQLISPTSRSQSRGSIIVKSIRLLITGMWISSLNYLERSAAPYAEA